MAHIYMSFDFGTDEEKAQLARHKLEMWKQAFRLDKKLLYKFERQGPAPVSAAAVVEVEEKPAKSAKAPGKSAKTAKGKAKAEASVAPMSAAPAAGPVKLHLRLGFSAHEKMTEERLVKRIPVEEPFKDAQPEVMRQGERGFDETAAVFDALD